MAADPDPQRGLRVKLYRNGDSFFSGRNIVVRNPKRLHWEQFLDAVTSGLQPKFGVVYKLYDAVSGAPVTATSQLEDGGQYVAAGRGRFKRLNYLGILDNRSRAMAVKKAAAESTRRGLPRIPAYQRIVRSGRALKKIGVRPPVITMALNGHPEQVANIVMIRRVAHSLLAVLELAGEKLKAHYVIFKICTVDGVEVTSLSGLKDKHLYVACGRGRFKHRRYTIDGGRAARLSPSKPAGRAPPRVRGTGSLRRANSYLSHHDASSSAASSPARRKPTTGGVSKRASAPSSSSSALATTDLDALPEPAARDPAFDSTKPLAPISTTTTTAGGAAAQLYSLTVSTGDEAGAGTVGEVFVTLYGARSTSTRRALRRSKGDFSMPGDNTVTAIESPPLGSLQTADVELVGGGRWQLKCIAVHDPVADARVYFHCQQWIEAPNNLVTLVASDSATPPAPAELVAANTMILGSLKDSVSKVSEATASEPPLDEAAPLDAEPDISSTGFEAVENQFKMMLGGDKKMLLKEWRALDYNGNGKVSLAEMDAWVQNGYPKLNNKPALMRAFKKTTLRDGDGDPWVEKFEFPALLSNLLYFNKLFEAFGAMDSDGDRRVNSDEFMRGMKLLGLNLPIAETMDLFDEIDVNGGGQILFDELCVWAARYAVPVDNEVQTAFTQATTDMGKAETEDAAETPVVRDAEPDVESTGFEEVEAKFTALLSDEKALTGLWRSFDSSGNGKVSLAEMDNAVAAKYPTLNNKRALMRAFKKTTLKDGDGDPWVERHEFPALLSNLLYFNKLYQAFAAVDTDGDHRISLEEFGKGMGQFGLSLADEECKDAFAAIDVNGGGQILFDELCVWAAKYAVPVDGEVQTAFTQATTDMGKAEAEDAAETPAVHDAEPEIMHLPQFDGAEAAIGAVAKDRDAIGALWLDLDFNGNGLVSLAEFDKWTATKYPVLNNKPALMRAFKQTTLKDGDGDPWVERHEFPSLLRNLLYFNKLYVAFDALDSGSDRRVDLAEFTKGLKFVGLDLSSEEAAIAFAEIDANGGGQILFDEFCTWAAIKRMPVEGDVTGIMTKKTGSDNIGAAKEGRPASAAADEEESSAKKAEEPAVEEGLNLSTEEPTTEKQSAEEQSAEEQSAEEKGSAAQDKPAEGPAATEDKLLAEEEQSTTEGTPATKADVVPAPGGEAAVPPPTQDESGAEPAVTVDDAVPTSDEASAAVKSASPPVVEDEAGGTVAEGSTGATVPLESSEPEDNTALADAGTEEAAPDETSAAAAEGAGGEKEKEKEEEEKEEA